MKNRSLLSVNFAVVMFGFAGIFAKAISIPSVGITFGRVFFSSITLFIYMKATHQSFKTGSRKDTAMLILSGGVLAFHWRAFLESIKVSTVAIGTITATSFPLFVTFLEPVFFRTKLTVKNVILALCMIAGVLITVPSFSFESDMAKGVVIGMLSALAYAILTLLNKSFTGRYSGTKISFYEQFSRAVILLPLILTMDIKPTVTDVGLLLLLGIFTTALRHTLFISSLKNIPAQLAGIISSMETVYGIVFARIILGEIPTAREIIGAAVIVGVVVISQTTKGRT